jgi:N-acetylglutamate synthase-like GNAT family acetyltransferase
MSLTLRSGTITVDPTVQNRGIGRQLMHHALERVAKQASPGVRLVQATYHGRSLSLYASLGFEVRESLACMQGPPLRLEIPGFTVRSAGAEDLAACDTLCRRVHGHDRSGEVREAMVQGTAMVVERSGQLVGYAPLIGFGGHAVGQTTDAIKALLGAASRFMGSGVLIPTRNGELFRWCLAHGLRVTKPMTLMSLGLYNEPCGAYTPSILY